MKKNLSLLSIFFSFVVVVDELLDPSENLLFGMELTWIVLISVCSLLIIFACLVGVAICLCRRNPINNNVNGGSHNNNGNGNFNQVQRECNEEKKKFSMSFSSSS